VGESIAKMISAFSGASIYRFSHQSGHIRAAVYSSGVTLENEEFIAFHVSGGTTEIVNVKPENNYYSIDIIGGSNDLHAGQAIDRIGVMLGLDFPAGRELEILARSFDGSFDKKKISVKNCRCNLSGVENIAQKLYENGESKEKIAAFAFDFIQRTLCEMASQVLETYGNMPILFAGGVMSNKLMRTAICKRFEAYFAEPEFSADNAAGVALLCRRAYMK
jgi:N6-L-threonylcarbamoyladenine synthase